MSVLWLLLLHALSTTIMAGVIWTMQLVHYALFVNVGAERFCAYQREHMRRISWIVGPMMGVELITASWLALDPPRGVHPWMTLLGVGLVGAIWLSTGLLQGPTHVRLARDGAVPDRIRFLLASNWIRTAAWSIRAPLALLMLTLGASAAAEGMS